jgi:hypothetical protein
MKTQLRDIDIGKAIFIGILTGWFGVLVIDILTLPLVLGNNESWIGSIGGIIGMYIMFGLIAAVIVCTPIILILWLFFSKNRQLSQRRAVLMGCTAGGILGLINVLMFMSQYGIGLAFDWLSTVAVGGFAGWTAFRYAAKPEEDLECFS